MAGGGGEREAIGGEGTSIDWRLGFDPSLRFCLAAVCGRGGAYEQ